MAAAAAVVVVLGRPLCPQLSLTAAFPFVGLVAGATAVSFVVCFAVGLRRRGRAGVVAARPTKAIIAARPDGLSV